MCILLYLMHYLSKHPVFHFASCCHDKTLTRIDLRMKGFIWLIGYSTLSREAKAGTQDGNLEVGTEAEITAEGLDFGSYPHGYLSYVSWAKLPGVGTTSRLGHPILTRNQKMPHRHIHRHLTEAIIQLWVPLPTLQWILKRNISISLFKKLHLFLRGCMCLGICLPQ